MHHVIEYHGLERLREFSREVGFDDEQVYGFEGIARAVMERRDRYGIHISYGHTKDCVM